MRIRWIVLAAALGCGPGPDDEEAFEAEFAARWCERQEECALGDFEREYSSYEDCVDEKEDDLDIPNWDQGCDIDPDDAEQCLDYLRETDCGGWDKDEIEDACREAYDC